MPDRIKRRPDELADQLRQAAAAATAAGAAWPAGAPTPAALNATATAIDNAIKAIDIALATAANERQTRDAGVDAGTDQMEKVDGFTDGLYGPDGPEKLNFGLPPKVPGGALGAPPKLTDLRLGDGQLPASIFADCETVDGNSSYEWEWYSDGNLTQRVGNTVTTASEFTINGLATGSRYWVRVRAIRGGQYGQWSDPDSRVANV